MPPKTCAAAVSSESLPVIVTATIDREQRVFGADGVERHRVRNTKRKVCQIPTAHQATEAKRRRHNAIVAA